MEIRLELLGYMAGVIKELRVQSWSDRRYRAGVIGGYRAGLKSEVQGRTKIRGTGLEKWRNLGNRTG